MPSTRSSYDGRSSFVRLRWGSGSVGSRGWSAAWNHDDPRAEQRVTRILDTVTDVPEYWEWSGTGMFAVDPSNETYKLGVNYVIGALTR